MSPPQHRRSFILSPRPADPPAVVIRIMPADDGIHLYCPTAEIARKIEAGRQSIEDLLTEMADKVDR